MAFTRYGFKSSMSAPTSTDYFKNSMPVVHLKSTVSSRSVYFLMCSLVYFIIQMCEGELLCFSPLYPTWATLSPVWFFLLPCMAGAAVCGCTEASAIWWCCKKSSRTCSSQLIQLEQSQRKLHFKKRELHILMLNISKPNVGCFTGSVVFGL